MIEIKIGDLFESECGTLVNTVNCVGVMGKGIAQKFKQHFPEMFNDYEARCQSGKVQPGIPYIYKNNTGLSIINFPTKNHWRSPALLEYITHGLDIFVEKYKEWGVGSVAFPPLGCGNGGLEWSIVGPIMLEKLSTLDIPVKIYAPYGTTIRLLSAESLKKQNNNSSPTEGRRLKNLKPAWIALIEVISHLEQQKYSNAVGRVIFQKICYVMTELNVDTGFNFKAGNYGPFSEEIKDAIVTLANSNLICEKPLGKMIQLKIGSRYEQVRPQFSEQIKIYHSQINKTVDLFSRIKNSDQAEEVATVLYASRTLKKNNNNVSEKDLYDYILTWKRKWDSDEKKSMIANTIRNLEMLNWLKLTYSDSLPQQPDDDDMM